MWPLAPELYLTVRLRLRLQLMLRGGDRRSGAGSIHSPDFHKGPETSPGALDYSFTRTQQLDHAKMPKGLMIEL